MRLFLFRLLVAACLLIAPLQPQSKIDIILLNGKIWTVNPHQPEAQAIAISGNRIFAVGSNATIRALRQPNTKVLDLQGRRVLPGFNDAHVHFYDGGANLTGVQLRNAKNEAEFRERISQFATGIPKGQWITGGNWDHENWTPARLPTRQLIDDVTPGHPVLVSRLDGHMALANSLALQLAGIDRNTKDVPGGVLIRDASGNPTGILKDAALGLVQRVIPAPSEAQIQNAIKAAMRYAAEQGVTSVQDMSASPAVLRAYQTLLKKGELHVRISGHQPLGSWEQLARVGMQTGFGNEYLHIGGLKGFADGSLGSTTALFFEPYSDMPGTAGIASDEMIPEDKMWKNIKAADGAGLQIAIHAIGDKANHTILNFYERLEKEHSARDRRLRIEHAQHLQPADVQRFGKLHVIASMQPYHAIDDGRWAEKRVGPKRVKDMYVFRNLLTQGAALAFGSDWPVAPMEPLLGIYAAVTRRTLDGRNPRGWIPEQKVTVAEAIHAYTMGSAYASFDDKIKGSIEPGKLADFAVLSEDILQIDPVQIAQVKVVMTIFDGKVIYQQK